jgi:putative transferase (TIGR04331 family)
MNTYQLALGKTPLSNTGKKTYPMGPWCFVGNEDKFPNWENEYKFPRIFPSISARSDAYEDCLKILDAIFPSFLIRYKKEFSIKEKYPDSFFRHILGPTLIKTISMIVGRTKYIEKFIELNADKNFIIPFCNKSHIQSSVDIYCVPEVHDWINFAILNSLSPPNVKISESLQEAKNNHQKNQVSESHQAGKAGKADIKNQIISFLRKRNKYFRGIYGPTIWEELYLDFILKFKPRLELKAMPTSETKVGSNIGHASSLDFIQSMCLELLPEPLGLNFNKSNQSALAELETYGNVQGKVLLGQTAVHNDLRIFFHAHWLLQGGRIGYAQHGGVYEAVKDHWASQIYEFLSDYFFSWGWIPPKEESYAAKFVPLPSFELSAMKNKHHECNNNLIYVGSSINPYYDGILMSEPIDAISYRASKQKFLQHVNTDVMGALFYREMQSRHKTELEDWDYLRKKGYNLPALKGHLISQAIYSRAVIADHYGTVFIQCLSANIPIIIFFGEQDYNLREDIENYFKLFKKVGIFHESPESAAQFLNDNFNSISEWWSTPELQQIRQDFCRKYAYTSDNCLKEWAKALWSLQ